MEHGGDLQTGACAPGTPDPPRKSEVYDKTLCVSSWGKCSFRGHTQYLARRLVRAPLVRFERELHQSLGDRCVRGAAKLESGSSGLLCGGATRAGDNSAGTQPTCKPGQDSNSFQSPFRRPEPDRYPGQPGEGGASPKAPRVCPCSQ